MVTKKNKDTTGMYILAIVIIVAGVGIFTALFPSFAVSSENTIGAVTAKIPATIPSSAGAFTKWTTCIDLGTTVKLGNREGGTLVKKNTCSGKSGQKLLVEVLCAQDVDGFYSYKYANPVQCYEGKNCLMDAAGAAYCS